MRERVRDVPIPESFSAVRRFGQSLGSRKRHSCFAGELRTPTHVHGCAAAYLAALAPANNWAAASTSTVALVPHAQAFAVSAVGPALFITALRGKVWVDLGLDASESPVIAGFRACES